MKRVFLAIAFVSALSIQTSATNYYVSTEGSDSNDGTSPATAWETINRVNGADFDAGDSISFKGGDTFTGNLYFDATDTGSATSPLTIKSYGIGRATINAGNYSGLYVYNAGGVDIANINFVGAGSTVNQGDGIVSFRRHLELMAHGVPVVATDLPSVREILTHEQTGILAEPSNPQSLALALRRVLDNPAFAAQLRGKALAHVTAFSWQSRARRMLTFFHSLP